MHDAQRHAITSEPLKNLNTELILLVTAEAELASGLAFAVRLADRSGYDIGVVIVADQPAVLLGLAKSRVGELSQNRTFSIVVESSSTDIDSLLGYLEEQVSLRVLLVPGLDQLNDNRKTLLRRVHSMVVCFESHQGLHDVPTGLWLLGIDEGGYADWLCEHMLPHHDLRPISLDELSTKRVIEHDETPVEGEGVHAEGALVLLSTSVDDLDSAAKQAKVAIEAAAGPVLLIRGEGNWFDWFIQHQVLAFFARFVPQMERAERRQLASQLKMYSTLDFEFIALICAATFLASFGLLQGSAAVIIGAMLVAPLMTPILGAGLSLAHGNRPLFTESIRTILIGILCALATSCIFGLLVRFIAPSILEHDALGRVVLTTEMWSRTHPTSIDFLVGFVGGSAAAFARTRTHLADALAGAAIAAALVPPIATAGLHLSFYSVAIQPAPKTESISYLFYGPLLLFGVNMLTIMIGSSLVLRVCGVRSEHTHSQRERWTTRMTVLLMTLTALVLVWIVQH